MSDILVLNSSPEAFETIVHARGLESFRFLRSTSVHEIREWLTTDGNKAWLILFDDLGLQDIGTQSWLEWLAQQHPQMKMGFLVAYGQERFAQQLYEGSAVNFYVQQPFSPCLIASEILACLEDKPSLSVMLNEILKMAIDANSTPVAEYIANIKRTFTTR
jgi:DNA-binding NtrC family response regulator